ncbi:hypothetical protein BIFGAL_03234 [Bifidobacterium gallicum DSM 20093 = LMG 11596]|uniref:Uncharacterized protein n=1 Tax=Bifidobacterium gallicum DSM 20093 = LMG 11596 TaxID=561180 RepID=D1NTR8_9BIFI|nr:hypothetical protein BIFGAL_03234 [Bifidobacterium gallicum DSM 20093 = LMG 11596]
MQCHRATSRCCLAAAAAWAPTIDVGPCWHATITQRIQDR